MKRQRMIAVGRAGAHRHAVAGDVAADADLEPARVRDVAYGSGREGFSSIARR